MRGKIGVTWVPDHVYSKPDGGRYYVGIGGGLKHPRDTTVISLADPPADQNVLEDPGGWFRNRNNNERYVLCFLHYSWNANRTLQSTANSRTKKTGDSSEAFDGREGCDERLQRSGDCSVSAL